VGGAALACTWPRHPTSERCSGPSIRYAYAPGLEVQPETMLIAAKDKPHGCSASLEVLPEGSTPHQRISDLAMAQEEPRGRPSVTSSTGAVRAHFSLGPAGDRATGHASLGPADRGGTHLQMALAAADEEPACAFLLLTHSLRCFAMAL